MRMLIHKLRKRADYYTLCTLFCGKAGTLSALPACTSVIAVALHRVIEKYNLPLYILLVQLFAAGYLHNTLLYHLAACTLRKTKIHTRNLNSLPAILYNNLAFTAIPVWHRHLHKGSLCPNLVEFIINVFLRPCILPASRQSCRVFFTDNPQIMYH